MKPVARIGNIIQTSRYDDVREVFANDQPFGVVYQPKVDIILGGKPFFLGMGDTPNYRHDTDVMRKDGGRRSATPCQVRWRHALAQSLRRQTGIDVVDAQVRA